MKNIKTKWYELQWLKIGFCNWIYYKDRKQFCYNGKHVTFQYNQGLFQAILIWQKYIQSLEQITATETL